MRTRKLGFTDLELTTIGFGAWAIGGGGYEFGWGPQDDRDSIAAIRKAFDLGINWIDTAPAYGLGRSEHVVGIAVEGIRDEVFLATKCSLVWGDDREIRHSLKAASVRRECEASLRRLNTDRIDLYQIHWPNPEEEIEEGWGEIANLIREGKVRYGGVSNFTAAQIDRCRRIHPVASLQPPYSMLRREVETELLGFCERHRIGVVAYSPMQCGLLSGGMTRERVAALPPDDWRKTSPQFQEPMLTANLEFAGELARLAARSGRSAGQLAIAWVLRRPEVASAIAGARNARQVEEIAPASDWELSRKAIEEVRALLEMRKAALSSIK